MNISQRIFVRAFLIVSCVFGVSNITAGVSDDTNIQGQDASESVRVLKVGDKLLCYKATDEGCLINHENEEDVILYDNDRVARDVKIRKLGGLAMAAFMTYTATKTFGYVSVGLAAGSVLVAGVAGGPGGLGAAYLGVLTTVPAALATVESVAVGAATVALLSPLP